MALNTITLTRFNGNTSYLTTSTLNTKYIWAVLIKLHDSHHATYDDRRKSYEWLKHQGTYKVRNEIETKRNKTKRNQRKRNETKRNQRKRNETKSTKWKRNETKPTK